RPGPRAPAGRLRAPRGTPWRRPRARHGRLARTAGPIGPDASARQTPDRGSPSVARSGRFRGPSWTDLLPDAGHAQCIGRTGKDLRRPGIATGGPGAASVRPPGFSGGPRMNLIRFLGENLAGLRRLT